MNKDYEGFAAARLAGKFREMGSWALVRHYLEGRRCLDVGCADGLYLRYFSSDSVGIEQIPELAARARTSRLNVITGDILQELRKIESHSFEAVLFSHVMEHLDSPIAALREIARVLIPNGILLLGLPIERNIYRDILNRDYFDGTHLYAFSVRNARRLLQETGFGNGTVIYDLPKCRGPLGKKILKLWNLLALPGREYFSMGYWIVTRKK